MLQEGVDYLGHSVASPTPNGFSKRQAGCHSFWFNSAKFRLESGRGIACRSAPLLRLCMVVIGVYFYCFIASRLESGS
jgi:hypothetical protein